MSHETDLLTRVVAELESRKGDLPKVAREAGLPYDTVLRIKNRENDPGYSKVRALADYFFAASPGAQSAPQAEHKAAA